jgi:PPOX class probable F420-dependent enzyme
MNVLDTTEAGSSADGRLREEVAWLTTVRADGRPQSVPVWFLCDGETLLVDSRPNQQKLKNVAGNPKVGLHLNSNARGGDVVRVEGTAEVLDGFPPAKEVVEYLEKYRESISRIGFDPEGFAWAYSAALRVTPGRWQVW